MADPRHTAPVLTARDAGLVTCRHCASVWPIETALCKRCGARLQSRRPNALSQVWAWWLAGLIAYVPANMLPMLITESIEGNYISTIYGGIVELWVYDQKGIAAIVFLASIVIPVAKFVAIAFLALVVGAARPISTHAMHWLHKIIELIGRWSMIDVFVVAILSALVHLGSLADIYPGTAAPFFAATVLFTMVSALCFDPRLIYDRLGKPADGQT